MQTLSLTEARAIALAAQGFGRPRPPQPGAADFQRVIDDVALVQIDSVNVLERSHYLPFFARLGAYNRAELDAYLYTPGNPPVFEQWGHQASFVPARHYGLMGRRLADQALRHHVDELEAEHPGYAATILEEVQRRGAVRVTDLEDGGDRTGPWWGLSKGKVALERHFGRGALAVAGRRNFARIYDVPERVFPAEMLNQPVPSTADADRQMVRIGARALGVATVKDLADYFRMPGAEARTAAHELADAGELEELRIEGWKDPAYLAVAAARAPQGAPVSALLSPFDSLVWDRARTERLFGVHYRIEIYTPQPKRIHGYYVMPYLLDDALVARVDIKANRQESTLQVHAVFAEANVAPKQFARPLANHLVEMAGWLGLQRIAVGERGDAAEAVRKAVPKRFA